jgi:hypothetical protein
MFNALVIQKNNYSYAECMGKTMGINCGTDVDVVGEHWATPAVEGGVFRGWRTGTLATADQPTPDSFKVLKLRDKISGDMIIVVGTLEDYNASCEDGGTTPMPDSDSIPEPILAYTPCDVDGDGDYEYDFPVPTIPGGSEIKAFVSVDDEQAVAPPAGGHASLAAVVTWLNTNYSEGGAFTWSNNSGRLKLVSTEKKKVGVAFTVGDYA